MEKMTNHGSKTKTWFKIKSDYSFLRERKSTIWAVIAALVFDPGFRALFIYRIQFFFTDKGFHRISLLIYNYNFYISGAEICVGATIGTPCIIRHPSGIVIGGGVNIGDSCILLQGITIGQSHVKNSSPNTFPVIFDNVTIGAKATLLGELEIASGTIIGAHALMLDSSVQNGIYVGVPAKLVGISKDSDE